MYNYGPALGMQNWALGAMRGALAPSEFKPAPSESDAKMPLTKLFDAGRVLYHYYLDFDGGRTRGPLTMFRW